RFSADIINPTPNFNGTAVDQKSNKFVLGHVESVSHSFAVGANGARTFQTSIEFVRGIFTDANGVPVDGEAGLLDESATAVYGGQNNNRNVFATSETADPDPKKLRGQ